jgi:hypothetical protein
MAELAKAGVPEEMPFEMKRMAYGGFKVSVDVVAQRSRRVPAAEEGDNEEVL